VRLKAVKHYFKEGEWLDHDDPRDQRYIGEELSFEDLTNLVNELIIMTKYTQSRRWLKLVRVHSFTNHPANAIGGYTRNLVYTDGTKSFGRVNEYWFLDNSTSYPVKCYRPVPAGFTTRHQS